MIADLSFRSPTRNDWGKVVVEPEIPSLILIEKWQLPQAKVFQVMNDDKKVDWDEERREILMHE